jgi:FtsP/CotA-like multicopper oxidase with cupredoxin domain
MTELPDLPDKKPDESKKQNTKSGLSRRMVLRVGAAGTAAAAIGVGRAMVMPRLRQKGLANADGMIDAASIELTDSLYTEVFTTSPLILNPFTDEMLVPKALSPTPVGELDPPPGPGVGQQNSFGNETHQIWTSDIGFPDPIIYRIKWESNTHNFTSSQVLPIDSNGKPTQSFDSTGKTYPAGTIRTLPPAVIWGNNGQLPGPMINAEYGKPVLVRFENHIEENPQNLDYQDFGAPDGSVLIHLHNGHTAPESDGNPHYAMTAGPKHRGFPPGSFVDQLYLNFPAGFDDREKVSFWWYHDHTMDHTSSNVYKGLFGMYPFYDPTDNRDDGDETTGLRLPGVRTNNPDGSFDVAYDIPLAFYDTRLEDGVTLHNDFHDPEYPKAGNPRNHPEWWGQMFFRHFPNHGFVGDARSRPNIAGPSWPRDLTPSSVKTLCRWYWSVCELMNNRVAISGLDSPSLAILAMRDSCAVSSLCRLCGCAGLRTGAPTDGRASRPAFAWHGNSGDPVDNPPFGPRRSPKGHTQWIQCAGVTITGVRS